MKNKSIKPTRVINRFVKTDIHDLRKKKESKNNKSAIYLYTYKVESKRIMLGLHNAHREQIFVYRLGGYNKEMVIFYCSHKLKSNESIVSRNTISRSQTSQVTVQNQTKTD